MNRSTHIQTYNNVRWSGASLTQLLTSQTLPKGKAKHFLFAVREQTHRPTWDIHLLNYPPLISTKPHPFQTSFDFITEATWETAPLIKYTRERASSHPGKQRHELKWLLQFLCSASSLHPSCLTWSTHHIKRQRGVVFQGRGAVV